MAKTWGSNQKDGRTTSIGVYIHVYISAGCVHKARYGATLRACGISLWCAPTNGFCTHFVTLICWFRYFYLNASLTIKNLVILSNMQYLCQALFDIHCSCKTCNHFELVQYNRASKILVLLVRAGVNSFFSIQFQFQFLYVQFQFQFQFLWDEK